MADDVREFKLPDLGEGLEEAEIVSWLVKEGEEVELNQPIVEVETEKALVQIPSPYAGVVAKLHGEVGDRVKVGAALVSIKTASGAPEAGKRREVLVGYGPEEEGSRRPRRKKIGRAAEPQNEPEAEGIKMSPLPVMVKALIAALRRHPWINGSWDAATSEIIVKHAYHIGIATDT